MKRTKLGWVPNGPSLFYIQELLQRNRRDHWFLPNQSEYSLFAVFIYSDNEIISVK